MYGPAKFLSSLLLALIALNGCQKDQEYSQQLLQFGTLVDIQIVASDQAQADQAFALIEEDFTYMQKTYYPWIPGALARTNALLAAGGKFSAGPSIRPLIVESQRIYELSDGLYNPAIGQLIKLWGFHKHDSKQLEPPDPEAIKALVKSAPAVTDIHVDKLSLQSDNSDVLLDFGGYAKGYALDVASEHLTEIGVTSSLINAGGDIKAQGQKLDQAWHIGIKHPRHKGMIASCELYDQEAIVTSGDYERFYEHQGNRHHHILDPRTGYPAVGLSSVTIIHQSAAFADAMATALFVAGPDGWPQLAEKAALRFVMVVDDKGLITMTPEMAKRLKILTDEPSRILQN